MKKITALIFSLSLLFSLTAQVEYLYDFNSLSVGTSNFHEQDGWSTHYQTAATSPDFNVDYLCENLIAPDESVAIWYPYGGPGVGRTATRKATPGFLFDFTNGGVIDLEMDMFRSWWGTYFGVGFDGDGDGNILRGMTDEDGGIYIRCAGSGNDYQPNLVLPDGTSIQITHYTQTGWARYRMAFDFNAFGGQGSVTVFVKDYAGDGFWGEWMQLSEATEINMGLTPGSGDYLDYQMWDGIFFHCQGGTGGFDNLLVRQMPTGNVQYISMDEIPKQLITNDPLTLTATATSGLPVTFELVSGPATLDGNVLTLDGTVGTVTLKAKQAGNDEWLPAPDVIKTFEVIDAQAYTPTITIRRPYEGTMVYMPELQPVLLVISAYIEHSDALHIEQVLCTVDGQEIQAVTYYPEDPENGYFSATWQPSAFGSYTMDVAVTTTGGKITHATNQFEVTSDFGNIDVVTMNGDLVCTPSVQAARGEYVMPSHTGAFNAINAFYDHNCVNNNCDTYDRVGGVRVRNYRGEWLELFRYITPFGVQCEDNVDVSDYTTVLQGLVEMELYFVSWNGSGFNPILTFNFTKGTPEYRFVDVQKIWDDTYSFGDYANQQPVPPVHYVFKEGAVKAGLKLITTGHNWSSNTSPNYSVNTGNAAEFYEATHNIKLNGSTKYNQHLWPASGNCSPNPAGCQPQAGTWTYPRAGWCPGSIATVWDFPLDEYVAAGAADIQYEFDPTYIDYCHPNYPDCHDGQNGCPNCDAPDNPILIVEGEVVTYSQSAEILGGEIVSVAEFAPTYDVQLYPNPARHHVTLTTDYAKGKLSARILNLSGQVVKNFAFQGAVTLDVSDLPQGVYLIQLLGDTLITKKLVVE